MSRYIFESLFIEIISDRNEDTACRISNRAHYDGLVEKINWDCNIPCKKKNVRCQSFILCTLLSFSCMHINNCR